MWGWGCGRVRGCGDGAGVVRGVRGCGRVDRRHWGVSRPNMVAKLPSAGILRRYVGLLVRPEAGRATVRGAQAVGPGSGPWQWVLAVGLGSRSRQWVLAVGPGSGPRQWVLAVGPGSGRKQWARGAGPGSGLGEQAQQGPSRSDDAGGSAGESLAVVREFTSWLPRWLTTATWLLHCARTWTSLIALPLSTRSPWTWSPCCPASAACPGAEAAVGKRSTACPGVSLSATTISAGRNERGTAGLGRCQQALR